MAFICNPSRRMNDSSSTVETTSRLAQWRIENLGSYCTYRKSNPFKVGLWNWHLAIEKGRVLLIKLYPEISNFTKENPPIASFIIRVLCPVGDRNALVHPEVTDRQLKGRDDFVWGIEVPLTGKFIIDVEFLDLKTFSEDGAAELHSIWTRGSTTHNQLKSTALTSVSKMLTESIHTDITITAQSTTFHAHRSILASRSPVFRSLFDLKHKDRSGTSDVLDISEEGLTPQTCRALLNYIYGHIETDEFLARRLELLRAADKYGIADLKEACHASLLEDIDAKNVLERLQHAWLFELDELKACCLKYLVRFGKVCDVRDEFFNVFLQCADRGLIAELLREILAAWKGF